MVRAAPRRPRPPHPQPLLPALSRSDEDFYHTLLFLPVRALPWPHPLSDLSAPRTHCRRPPPALIPPRAVSSSAAASAHSSLTKSTPRACTVHTTHSLRSPHRAPRRVPAAHLTSASRPRVLDRSNRLDRLVSIESHPTARSPARQTLCLRAGQGEVVVRLQRRAFERQAAGQFRDAVQELQRLVPSHVQGGDAGGVGRSHRQRLALRQMRGEGRRGYVARGAPALHSSHPAGTLLWHTTLDVHCLLCPRTSPDGTDPTDQIDPLMPLNTWIRLIRRRRLLRLVPTRAALHAPQAGSASRHEAQGRSSIRALEHAAHNQQLSRLLPEQEAEVGGTLQDARCFVGPSTLGAASGLGLFAGVDIRKNETITSYSGPIIYREQAWSRLVGRGARGGVCGVTTPRGQVP